MTLITLCSHDVREGQVEADHFARSMPNTDSLTLWTGHDHQLRRHSTSPVYRHLAIPDDWRISKFWAVDIGDPQSTGCILALLDQPGVVFPPRRR